ncbi:cystatin-like [Sphaerodactylus townsendi]|uniref:cystatin-like n=1 Tax=Sphaerodactylus townsendi TaxID=933632 RepID=UPI002025EFA4|nr:cystatin-like [Sphaerodactylus townsendi]
MGLRLGVWLGLAGLLLLSGGALGASALGRPGQRMVGAPVEASLEEPEVKQALQFAVQRYNRGTNDAFHSRVAEVLSAHKQIVAGVKYIFNVKVGRTRCRNSEAVVEDCEFMVEPDQAKQATCTFEVYVVPWINKVDLVKNDCQ